MTVVRWKSILALAAVVVVALAFGAASADAGPVTAAASKPAEAPQPPWLLLSGIAIAGTLLVGGAAVGWARMLEKLGPALERSRSFRSR